MVAQRKEVEIVETTLGELIEMITSLASKTCKNERESYELVSLTLEDLLNNKTNPESTDNR